jgi:hypothetical protein
MRYRSLLGTLLMAAVVPFTSCVSSPSLTSITVTPGVMNFGGAGLTTQLTAIGSYTRPNHAAVTRDITNQVNWSSSTPQCVTVSSTGLITSGSNICSGIPITASAQGFHGIITGSMTVNVTQPATASTDVATVTVTPITSNQPTGTQVLYTANGFDGAGNPLTLVNPPTWSSSNQAVATIMSSGLAINTANASTIAAGTATISANYTNPDGTKAISVPATLTVQ